MFDMDGNVGSVMVTTTANRGMNAEEWAEAAVRRIVSVSLDSPMPIREQAFAFRESVKNVLIHYFKKVARSERTTIRAILEKEGYSELAKHIEDI
jgi:hypothetical protein|tara:strand:+ start:415 stop:699 length:285 start_codon:yes stop_codon:yes gene_type:complete